MHVLRTVMVSLVMAGGVHAAALTPRDFAYGLPVVASANAAPAYRFALPLAVYAGTVRDDLGDLRLFNAQGESVPYALQPAKNQAPDGALPRPLPLFPLRDGAGLALIGDHLAGDSPADGAPVNQYVLDARGMDSPMAALLLDWPTSVTGYSGRARVEVSDDLDAWRTVVVAAPVANLPDTRPPATDNRIAFAPVKARYWRISWVGPAPRVALMGVRAEAAAASAAGAGVEVAGVADPGEPATYDFDLGAHPPVTRVNLRLPEINTAHTIELSSRRSAQDSWRTVASDAFYRIRSGGAEQENPALDIAVDHDRYWRARIVHAGNPPQAPLRLRVDFVPQELTFLAQGSAPYLLAYGNAAATGAQVDLSQIPATAEIASAHVGVQKLLGGRDRLAPGSTRQNGARNALVAVVIIVLLVTAAARRRYSAQ